MQIKKICFTVSTNYYDSKRYFCSKFTQALERKGVEVIIQDLGNYKKVDHLFKEQVKLKPDLTCSFNTYLTDEFGKYIFDETHIPHLSMLVDPAPYFISLVKSPYALISCVDRKDEAFVRSYGFERVFFFPHAIDGSIHLPENESRPYDVTFLGSSTDYVGFWADWHEHTPRNVAKALEGASQLVLSDRFYSLEEALKLALKHYSISFDEINYNALLTFLDWYTRGRDRVELIRSIKNAHVHVFGNNDNRYKGVRGWPYYLKGVSNVTIHPGVTYPESLEIMKKSKICLNSMPFFKDGTHERVFASLACGAVPLTSATLYLQEYFKEGQELLMYQPGHWDKIDGMVVDLLKNDEKRHAMIQSGRPKVMKDHTWDARADLMLKVIPPMIDEIESLKNRSA